MRHELLTELQRLRNQIAHGRISPDGAEIAEHLKKAGVVVAKGDFKGFVAFLNTVVSDFGLHCVPPPVLDAVRLLLEGRRAALAFDPWAGLGVLAATVHEVTTSDNTIACCANSVAMAIGKALCPELDVRASDPLTTMDSFPNQIDVVASVLPFGVRSPRSVELTGPTGEKVANWHDWGQLLLAAASQRLTADGIGIFVVTPSFFFSGKSILPNLARLGLGVEAALALPARSFAPNTNISAFLIVVRRNQFDRMFVAQLSQDSRTNRQVIANLRDRVTDGDVDMGRLVVTSEFRGLESMRFEEQISQTARRLDAPVVTLGDLATELIRGRAGDSFEFAARDNCIFIPLVGNTDVVTSLDQATLKRQNYAQAVIDPAKSDARFVAHFLNSALGGSIRNAKKTGATIPMLNVQGLEHLPLIVPPRTVQQSIIEIEKSFATEANTILGLQNELAALRRDLWSDPQKRNDVQRRVKTLSARLASGATPHVAATLDQWFETLPFPLASILRAWQATPSQDFKTKYEHLLHFFEAKAEFLAVICLSAFGSREEIYAQHREKLVEAWKKQNLSLQRATFGLWKVAVEVLAKQIRILLAGDNDAKALCAELFGDPSLALPRMLAKPELVEVLSATNKMRNDWSGHGGVVSPAEARTRNELLVTELQKVREVMADGWSGVHLIRASQCQMRRGSFDTEVALMIGSNSEFLKESRKMSTCLDVERLYLAARDAGRPLQLLPFLHVGPSPASAKNACYFYNRVEKNGEVRSVSYHFVDQPERTEQAADTFGAIRFLSEGNT
jgi:hypothetical protein